MELSQFTNLTAVVAALNRAAEQLIPPANIPPSVWAEGDPARGLKPNVQIPVGNAVPGPINFDNAPYQREMLDWIKEPGVYAIDLMLGAQLGKTTVLQCATGFYIAHEPRSMMMSQPSEGDLQTYLETKLTPMIEANPAIAKRLAKPRGREGVNNSRIKSFIGGFLMFSWAGSPKTARGRSAPKIFMDEVDGYEKTKEGNFMELMSQRAASFGDEGLVIRTSTPTIKGKSNIETGFLAGDQRRYYVPCPHCGEPQYLRWERVMWSGRKSTDIKSWQEDLHEDHKPNDAEYLCEVEGCGMGWSDGERIAAIRTAKEKGGGWKASKPYTGHISAHAPEMLSTFRDLKDIVRSYLSKIRLDDMQSFVNVSLGETYEESGEEADASELMKRREKYAAQVPMGGVWIGAGIDMQPDRLEVQRIAFGVGEEAWVIDHKVLWGDPLLPDVWRDLEDLLEEELTHESGVKMRIGGACLDTGGNGSYPQTAYDWLRGKTGRRIFGIKGIPMGWGKPIVEKPQRKQSGKNARKIDLFLVSSDEGKLVVMRRLNLKPHENPDVRVPGYIHFPLTEQGDEYQTGVDEEYFKQLTSEKLITHYVKGFAQRKWTKPDKARNEVLDTFVYAYAALKIMQPNLKSLAEKMKGVKVNRFANVQKVDSSEPKPAVTSKILPVTEAEIPQEEMEAPSSDNQRIVRTKRVLNARKRGGSWATKW
jgi:phage terminase large subunit GpA-like protein